MSDIREANKWLENNPICDADDLNKRERELVQAAWQAALSANGEEPVVISDSDFDETNPIHQTADAYSYACEIMEQHQAERAAAGKEPGTTGSLCDGIAWLYEHIRELENAGKVVGDYYDLGVALSRHFDELRDSDTGHIAFDPCDSNDIDEVLAIINAHLSLAPSPDHSGDANKDAHGNFKQVTGYDHSIRTVATSSDDESHIADAGEVEIKAEALESMANKIERECPIPSHDAGVGECLDMIRHEAARLRTAGDEGEA